MIPRYQTLSLYGPLRVEKVTGSGRPYYTAMMYGLGRLTFKTRTEVETFAEVGHTLALAFASLGADRVTMRYFQNREELR